MMCMAAMVVSGSTGVFAVEKKNLEDGTYKASVYNNSKMMNLIAEDNNMCTVTVKDGKAVAHVRLNGDGYDKLFLGTREEAAANKDESKFILHEEYEKGKYAYDIPVEEFGKVMNVASLGTKWYDRKFVFYLETPEVPEIRAIKKSNNAIEVEWTNKPEHATGYQLHVSTTGDVEEPDEWRYVEFKSNKGVIKNLDAGEKIYVRVGAVINPFGETQLSKNCYWSSVKEVSTLNKRPVTSVKTVTSPTKKTLNVTWTKKTANVTGYQIMYSTSSNFKNAKTVTVTKNTTTSKKLTKLTGGKKYYVKVRTYQEIGGTKYPSAWSAKKSVKVK